MKSLKKGGRILAVVVLQKAMVPQNVAVFIYYC
jgi:hypothetical protein